MNETTLIDHALRRTRASDARPRALWKMTPAADRRDAPRRARARAVRRLGRALYQAAPMVNGEFEYSTMFTPEVRD